MNLNLLISVLLVQAAILFNVANTASLNFEAVDPEHFDETSKDNSVFDKMLEINQKPPPGSKDLIKGDIVETELVKEIIKNHKRGPPSNVKEYIWPIVNEKHDTPYQISKEHFDEVSKDNSAFDKILEINQKTVESPSGEEPKLFEGDIVETELVKEVIENRKRGAASNITAHIWPIVNGAHEIPYLISKDLSHVYYQNIILEAMREWTESVPCLRFVERSNQIGYIHFVSGTGCSSFVGRQGREQKIWLHTFGCMHHGIIVHEIGHALGFWHEQSRSDRDNYLTIHWENIKDGKEHNFDTRRGYTDDASVGYDYASIMQYGPKAFSRNGNVTIEAKNGDEIGQRQGLSKLDVKQANIMYGCSPNAIDCYMDTHENCKYWAGKGHCTDKYRLYMENNCKRSCHCSNRNSQCQGWADRGDCTTNPDYMQNDCFAACCKC